jgi:putative sterol carrier protein
MLETIFTGMPDAFVPGVITSPTSFYFSLGECKKTVQLSVDQCLVSDGHAVAEADCVCKTTPDFFVKIWEEGYRPGMLDFLGGTIKSNKPEMLQTFLRCFGKAS